jgi:hypothetical protein
MRGAMKVLLLVVALALAGCLGSDSETAIHYHWTLKWAGSERPGTVTCAEADGNEILFELDTQPGHADPRFACDARETIVSAPPGAASVFALLSSNEPNRHAGDSRETLFGDTIGTVEVKQGQTVDFDVVIPLTYLRLSWSIEKGGRRLTCEEAGARTILIDTTREYAARRTFEIPCAGSTGVTGAVSDTYNHTVYFSLVGDGGEVLASTTLRDQFGFPDGFDTHSGEVGNLGMVEFEVR